MLVRLTSMSFNYLVVLEVVLPNVNLLHDGKRDGNLLCHLCAVKNKHSDSSMLKQMDEMLVHK